MLDIGIFSRCYVCLDQLEKNQKRTGGVFDVKAYSRKELICDMDTVGNKLRSLRYHFKIIEIEHRWHGFNGCSLIRVNPYYLCNPCSNIKLTQSVV